MKTTSDYLDEVRRKLHLRNDSELARAWKVSTGLIGHYRSGRASMSEERVLYVAELLELPLAEVWTAIALERAKRTQNEALVRRLAEYAKRTGLMGLLAATLAVSPSEGNANDLHIIRNGDRRRGPPVPDPDGRRAYDRQRELFLHAQA